MHQVNILFLLLKCWFFICRICQSWTSESLTWGI